MKRRTGKSGKTSGRLGPGVLITILAVVAVLILLLRMATFVAPHVRRP